MPLPSMGDPGQKNHMPLLVSYFNVVGSGELKVGNRIMKKNGIKQVDWILLKTGAKSHCLGSL